MTSAQLLELCQDLSGLPAVNEEMPPEKWYRFLTRGQEHWFLQFATHVPASQYGPPEKLETTDEGETYVFPVEPYGRATIREGRTTGRVLRPGSEWDPNADLVIEGRTIRFPNGEKRLFPDGPYARYAPAPGKIDAATQPTLRPEQAHPLIAYHALSLWASAGGFRDPAYFDALAQKLAWGDPRNPGDVGLMDALKAQYLHQGGSAERIVTHWTESPDLGSHYR